MRKFKNQGLSNKRPVPLCDVREGMTVYVREVPYLVTLVEVRKDVPGIGDEYRLYYGRGKKFLLQTGPGNKLAFMD